MTMISESGAIRDVNEIAAALGTTAEVIQAEDDAIATASLESLLEDIEGFVVHDYNDDTPVFQLAPAVESVLGIASVIQESGAISRSDASTLHQMTSSLEEFKGAFDCLPVGSYTELPSRVNFEASMESVFGNIGRKIVEIIKNIIKWIKDKAKAFVDLFRDKRVKTAKAAEASKKVDAALEETRKNIEEMIEEMRKNPLYAETNEFAKKNAARAKAEKIDLDIPTLFAKLTDKPTDATLCLTTIINIVKQMDGGAEPASFFNPVHILNKTVLNEPVEVPGGDDAGYDLLKAILVKMRETANDSDIISTVTPEQEISKRLRAFDQNLVIKSATVMATSLVRVTNEAQKNLNKILGDISEKTSKGERLANEDPLMVSAQAWRKRVQACSDINDIHTLVMSSWSKTIQVGAKLTATPTMGKAA